MEFLTIKASHTLNSAKTKKQQQQKQNKSAKQPKYQVTGEPTNR